MDVWSVTSPGWITRVGAYTFEDIYDHSHKIKVSVIETALPVARVCDALGLQAGDLEHCERFDGVRVALVARVDGVTQLSCRVSQGTL